MSLKPSFVVSVAVLVGLTAACTSTARSTYFGKTDPPPGQVFRYVTSEPESLDPQLTTGQPEARIFAGLYDGLTEYDPITSQPIPGLAERWDVNADNTEFNFHLRRNGRWSDGTPITAADVVYTFRRGLAPELAARAAYLAYDIVNAQAFNEGAVFVRDPATGTFLTNPDNPSERLTLPGDATERAKALAGPSMSAARNKEFVPVRAEDVGVDALDPYTVRIRLRQPLPFLAGLVAHQFFRPVPRHVVERFGEAWTNPEHIVTSGAYKVQSRKPYDELVVVRDPMNWDAARARLDRISFFSLENLTTMMNLYKAGEIDAVYNHIVPAAWIDDVRGYKDYMDMPEASTEYYLFNTTKAPMTDVRVRKAFNAAIDKHALAQYRRVLKASTSAVPEGVFPGYPHPPGDEFNPERARRLLAEAGYRDASGQYDPSKFPLQEVELTYNTSENHRQVAEFVQAQWKQHLQLTVPLKNMEFKTFLVTRAALQYKGVSRAGWAGDYMDPFTFLSLYITKGGDNGSGWTDPRYSKLLVDANRVTDSQKRYAMLAQAEAILLEAQPIIPLASMASNWVRKPYVKGMYPNPLTIHSWKFVYIEHDPSKWN